MQKQVALTFWSNTEKIIETSLQIIHKQFSQLLKNWPMNLLVVVAPRSLNRVPMLYRTEAAALIPEPYFYAVGSGKPVADYLADRLYEHEGSASET
jgi:hypothetical protein